MADGKQNYEREKARRDMADEIYRASQIRNDRERDFVMAFAGIIVLAAAPRVTGAAHGDPATTVASALADAKRVAEEANPLPATD